MNIIRLSHSSIETYTTCPHKYFLHYIEKIRPETISSPLFFGKSIDAALNILLLKKKKNLNIAEEDLIKQDPYHIFDLSMHYIDINGELVYIATSERADYFSSDCDTSILTIDDIQTIKNTDFSYLKDTENTDYNVLSIKNYQEINEFVEFYKQEIKNKSKLPLSYKKFYNYICWLSLRRKGGMMIKAYIDQVLPNIIEVHSIQDEINLPNEAGDYIVGFIDFVATWKDGKKYIFDNKTASRPYKEDSVITSQQLAIYSEFMGMNFAGYIVILKEVRKKDPKIKIQVVLGEIKDEQFEKVFDKIGKVGHNIKEGKFDQDLNNCFQFGKPCPYFKYCRNKDTSGLKKLEK